MSWGKLDDGFHSHARIVACSFEALGLFAVAISWASDHETDGILPEDAIPFLTRGRSELVSELLMRGLWERNDHGYQIRDFLQYNPSRQYLTKRRKKHAKAVKKSRHERDKKVSAHRAVSDSSPGSGRVGPGSKYWRTVPEGEILTDKRRADAAEAGLANGEVEMEWRKLLDHEFFRRKQDVDKTWRNWCREAVARDRPRQAGKPAVRVLPDLTGIGRRS